MSEFRDLPDVRQARRPQAVRESNEPRGNLAATVGNAGVARLLTSIRVQRAGETNAQRLDESVARAIEERRGQGRPLADDVRANMETALGHDLSGVRVHTDNAAHTLNEAVRARAFTSGNDVFFKQRTYDPSSPAGRELLAHELTHVTQQRSGTSGLSAGEVSHPSDAAEQHAASVGKAVARDGTGPSAPGPTASVALTRQAAEGESDDTELGVQRDAIQDVAPEDEGDKEESL